MLHPSYADLMKVVNSGVEEGEHPVVNSRYSIVIATSKRARQIIGVESSAAAKGEKRASSGGRKPLSVAIEELNSGNVKIVGDDEGAQEAQETSELQEMPEMSEMPEMPEMPEMAGMPETSEMPAMSETVGLQETE